MNLPKICKFDSKSKLSKKDGGNYEDYTPMRTIKSSMSRKFHEHSSRKILNTDESKSILVARDNI